MDSELVKSNESDSVRKAPPGYPGLIAAGKGRPKGSKNKLTLLIQKQLSESNQFATEVPAQAIKNYKKWIEIRQLAKVAEKLDSPSLDLATEPELKLRLDLARTVKTDPQEVITQSLQVSITSGDLIKIQELLGK